MTDPACGRDRIELRGLRLSARCGVLPEERTRDQPLEIDINLAGDFSAAGASDALSDTIDYGAVCDVVEQVCASNQPQLLERLAEQIAAAILNDVVTAAGDVPVDAVTVAVRKLRPPVRQQLATSGVRITRSARPHQDNR